MEERALAETESIEYPDVTGSLKKGPKLQCASRDEEPSI